MQKYQFIHRKIKMIHLFFDLLINQKQNFEGII